MNNTRQIKLALTVGLLNLHSENNLIKLKQLMRSLKEYVGGFLNQQTTSQSNLDKDHLLNILILKYEYCTLQVNIVLNKKTNNQYINGFEINH